MTVQPRTGQALAELVGQLTPEEKQEFVRWLSRDALEALRNEGPVSPLPVVAEGGAVEKTAARSTRRAGEPRVYVGATSDGLALEMPVECVAAFVERLPTILSVLSVEVYLRQNGGGEEHRVGSEEFASFLDTHQDVLRDGSLMMEFGRATLVSGGGGCMLLTLEGIPGEVRRRVATEALRAIA